MVNLTSKQQTFVRQMAEADDYARRGFDLLLKRGDFESFFDALAEEHIFDPDRNPGPVPGDTAGFFRIPYWEPLRYLEAVAKLAGDRNDLNLAEKVMKVVRDVSRWRDADGNVRDNHNTYNAFTKILGLVPTQAVTIDDIDLIPLWLEGKFNPSAVAFALAGGTLKRFLDSAAVDDWRKACRIVRHCTAILWIDDKFREEKKPATAIQDYWVKEIVKRTAAPLGTKLGEEAVALFIERTKQVYSQNVGQKYSYISRAAVEDSPQNHSWRGPENWSVEGLRDSLLSWVDRDAASAQSFIESLYQDDAPIIRRVAIYVLDVRFESQRTTYPKVVGPALFSTAHLHELYNLLQNHFSDFTDDEKAATVAAIRKLPKSETAEDPDRSLKYVQRQWLSAIVNCGSAEVDSWYQELSADPTLGGLSPHPSFMSYTESRWGHGPTPYPVQELVVFAKEGTIIDRLNSFVEAGSWSGPSTQSLVDTLVEAIAVEPSTFLAALGTFLAAKRPYQYGIISGFKKVWDAAPDMTTPIDWNKAWPPLIDFFQSLIRPDEFWTEEVAESDVLTPSRDWIPATISEFLRAGVRNDAKAYPPDLLPQGWSLIEILVSRSKKQSEADPSGAMDKAINSAKGIAIEALIDHALRSCRVSDAATGQHADVWDGMAATFDEQLAQCRNDNYEFSTLAGAYINHIHYMSKEWCERNFASVFPKEYPPNCLSAIDGLAWAPPSGPIYRLLLDYGIIIWGLRNIPRDYRARENILERIALAYLWEIEPLTSDHFSYVFSERLFDDLQHIAQYFWSVSEQPLSDRQKALIVDFWYECVTRTRGVSPEPSQLLSTLSHLSCYLTSVDEREEELLLAVAPYVGVNYNADQFVEQLARLVDDNPVEVSRVLDKMLKAYKPDYDFEDRLKNLLRSLADCESTRIDALRLAEQLVGQLPGMVEVYKELTSGHPAPEA
jgi:hypothetical protein